MRDVEERNGENMVNVCSKQMENLEGEMNVVGSEIEGYKKQE